MRTHHVQRGLACVLAIAVVGSATLGCKGVVEPTKNQIETFTGTIQPGEVASHSFSVSRSGEYSITLISLSPPVSLFVSVLLGQIVVSQCVPFIGQKNDFALAGRVVLSGSISPGSYCVAIADLGNFTVAETYTLQVAHP